MGERGGIGGHDAGERFGYHISPRARGTLYLNVGRYVKQLFAEEVIGISLHRDMVGTFIGNGGIEEMLGVLQGGCPSVVKIPLIGSIVGGAVKSEAHFVAIVYLRVGGRRGGRACKNRGNSHCV